MMLARRWRSGGSYLYATDDGGATWSKFARAGPACHRRETDRRQVGSPDPAG